MQLGINYLLSCEIHANFYQQEVFNFEEMYGQACEQVHSCVQFPRELSQTG